MDEDLIRERLEEAARNLLRNQPNFFRFTSETHQTEWNIAHHFANELHKLFPGHDCDLDIVKPNLEKRRPDIILHERGSHIANFLVIEVKRDRGDVDGALLKIKEYWFSSRLRYQFGAVIVITEGEEPSASVIPNTRVIG